MPEAAGFAEDRIERWALIKFSARFRVPPRTSAPSALKKFKRRGRRGRRVFCAIAGISETNAQVACIR